MTSRSKAFAVVAPLVACFLVWAALAFDPIKAVNQRLMALGGGRADANVDYMYLDPSTQEASRSDHALASLQRIEPAWCGAAERTRFMLMGNSQTLAIVLSPTESPVATPEKTYPDYLLDLLHRSGASVRGYRLSAPNISYTEVLWYLTYLVSHPCLTPTDLILQLNFETFRKSGIRNAMLELLDDPAFAAAAGREAQAAGTYGPMFRQAIDRYRERTAATTGEQDNKKDNENSQTKTAGVAGAQGPGAALETRVRELLDSSVAFNHRAKIKGELLNSLYLTRVYFLGIKTSTKRSISTAMLSLNVSALERIGELCRAHGIRLTVFNAPQNPLVPLYQTEVDRRTYHQTIADIARRYAWKSYDFENSIDKEMWGVWLDGPDPIHFGRAAHQRFARILLDAHVVPVSH
jgi:hypothetical protein